MLEARAGKDGPEWQYAFAPMTIYALKASWKGQRGLGAPDPLVRRLEVRDRTVLLPRGRSRPPRGGTR